MRHYHSLAEFSDSCTYPLYQEAIAFQLYYQARSHSYCTNRRDRVSATSSQAIAYLRDRYLAEIFHLSLKLR
ncbi:hypothetical protein [Chroococcidiopsis sp. SAG 2025]|uniref:hypothetical protein n=1 Tax=Chroococcidiopsis sp. SAG 2025 TaxID=171389 RepID=UPI002936E148|nr:hypothetical protein [Chroococcidiopsis sp. SAG 2025]